MEQQLAALYDRFPKNGQAPWEQLSFSMERFGKLAVNNLYDAVNEKMADS